MNQQPIRRVLLLLPLVALLMGFSLIAWQAHELRQFKQYLLRCEIGAVGCQSAQREWLARKAADLASGFRTDSETAELLARAEVLFSANETELPAKRARLKKALFWSDQAIAQRPAWAYAHAARLMVLLKLGDLDAQSDRTWQNAWRQGPNEKRVLKVLAEAVFVYRDAGRPTPTSAAPILDRLAWHDRAGLIELGTRFGGRDMLCAKGAALASDPICQPLPNRS